jgi:hypothetical protein
MKKREEKLPARRSVGETVNACSVGNFLNLRAHKGTGYIISSGSYQDLVVWPGRPRPTHNAFGIRRSRSCHEVA